MKKTIFVLMSILMITSLVLSACSQSKTTEPVVDEQGYPMDQAAVDQADQGYPAGEQPSAGQVDAGYPAPISVFVGTDATFPPFEMVDETTKEYIGFDMDLIRAIAIEAGLNIVIESKPFDIVLSDLELCKIDMAIAAITITDERKTKFLFSEPYVDAGQIITVKAGNTSITGKADLNGKIIGAQLGTTGEIEAKAIEGVVYKPYDTYDLAFLELINGQIDAVIADNPTALGFIEMNPGKLMTVGEVFTSEFYGIAICNDRQDLLDKINPALNAVIESGYAEELAAKYLAGQ
ncbi:MAG: basic amino acid ABC transporter substrate-binding protein [Chloroflexi bacterium HGW-Chloroflexi-3]|nr:MAG: basic amino acid ABC transporter substrate-binding protein [Chloroflexi bacterium HGW-Chloroflexi-3]